MKKAQWCPTQQHQQKNHQQKQRTWAKTRKWVTAQEEVTVLGVFQFGLRTIALDGASSRELFQGADLAVSYVVWVGAVRNAIKCIKNGYGGEWYFERNSGVLTPELEGRGVWSIYLVVFLIHCFIALCVSIFCTSIHYQYSTDIFSSLFLFNFILPLIVTCWIIDKGLIAQRRSFSCFWTLFHLI